MFDRASERLVTPTTVTVVVPALDEAGSIVGLLETLEAQDHDRSLLRVIIADGGSTDDTKALAERWAMTHELAVTVIDNPGRLPASGMNLGIEASTSDVVIVLGAHAEVPADFVRTAVTVLDESRADCAGGVLHTAGRGRMGQAIAVATTSPFGVGNAVFRTGSPQPRDVDTVAFGAYRREVFDRIGRFDTALLGAEDDELNFRLVMAGGRVRFDPAISATYFCRTSLRGLARQYFQYGRGKTWVVRKHHRAPSVRMLVPAAFVGAVVTGLGASVALRRVWPLLTPLIPYGAVLALGSRSVPAGTRRRDVAAALLTLHAAYGVGTYVGWLQSPPRPVRSSS